MKYRQHKGGLSESMATVRDIAATRQAMFDALGLDATASLDVKPYGYDSRIGWDTHIVTVEGYGVVGFTDGPVTL